MDALASEGKSLGSQMLTGLSKNTTYLFNKGVNYLEMRKLLNPFDIYEFSVILYWFLCFKLSKRNKIQKKETFFTDTLVKYLSNDKEKFKTLLNSYQGILTQPQKTSIIENVDKYNYVNSIVKETIYYILAKDTRDQKVILEELYKLIPDLDIKVQYTNYIKQINDIDQGLKHPEWYPFVDRWNNGNCSKTDYDEAKSQTDKVNDAVSKVTKLSQISTSSKTTAVKTAQGEVMSAGADSSNPPEPDNLILERIPVALSNQSNCNIDSINDKSGTDIDNPLMVCNESTILENFINFDIIKDDLIDIVSMVCDRILYGDWDNCFFDWYDSSSEQYSYRFPQMTNFEEQPDGALLRELMEGSGTGDTQFQIEYLTKFRNRLKQLISLNTPELNEIIRLHTISLKNETKDNNLEFYKKIIDDSEEHTYSGTLETFRILNRNIFNKYKKSKINTNPCVENSRKKELNEMCVSLAWRTLFNLKKTILYLYTFCITIIKNNYLLDINPDDYKNGSKNYIVDTDGISKSVTEKKDTSEDTEKTLFYIQRTPMLDINHISIQIFNLRKDFGLLNHSNNPNDFLNINTHLLHTEYISMLYQALCKDVTEDEARDEIQQLDNSNDNSKQQLDIHLNNSAEELNNVVDNLSLKGGIFSKKLVNPSVILNNIKNNFDNIRASMTDGYKSIVKLIDNRNKNEKLYHQSSKLLINNYNLENLYNLVDGAIGSILKKNYLTFFSQISSLINFSFDVMGNQLTNRQLIDKFSLDDKSITDKIYPENLGIIEKHILIGCSYRRYTDTQNNYKLMFIRYDILDKIRRIQYNEKQKVEMIKKYLVVKDIPPTLVDSSGSITENTFFNSVLNIISSYNIQEKQQISEYSNIIGTIMDYALGRDMIYCKLLYSYSFNAVGELVKTGDKENIINYIYQGHSPYFSTPTMTNKTNKYPYYLNKIDKINNLQNNTIKKDNLTHIGSTIKYRVDNNAKIPKNTLGTIIGIVDNSDAPYLVKFANDVKNIMKLTSAEFYPGNQQLSAPSTIDELSIDMSKWIQDSNGYLPIYYTHKVGYHITKNTSTTLGLNYPIIDSLKQPSSSWSKVFINNNKSYYWTYLSKNNSRISSGDIFYSFYHPKHCLDGKCNGKDLPLEELNKIIRYPDLQIYMLTPKGINYFIKEGIPSQNNWKTGTKGITQMTMLNIKQQQQTITPYFSKLSIQPKLDETLVNRYYYLDINTFLKHIKKNLKYIIEESNKPENKELIDKIITINQNKRWWETPNNISTLSSGGRMSKKSKSFYSLSSNKTKKNTHNYKLQGGSNILKYLAIIVSGFKQNHFILNTDKLEYQVREDEINLYTKTKFNDIHIPISPSNISIVDIYSKKLEEIINNDISLNIVQLLSNKENNIIKGGLVNEVCSNIETCEYVIFFQTLYKKIKVGRSKNKVYDEIVSKLIKGDVTKLLPNITIDNAEKLFCMLNISIKEKINCSNLSGGNKTKKKRKTKKK